MKVKGDEDQAANAATAAGQTRSPRDDDRKCSLKEGSVSQRGVVANGLRRKYD
jgi:hypothetical protein